MAAIRQTFFQECEEQLAELESGLTNMDGGAADAETVNAVFRAVHSIKGSAGIFALDELVKFAHVFETTLDAVRSGRLPATPDVIKILLQASDTLSDVVRAARGDGAADDEKTQKVVAALKKLIAPASEQSAPAASSAKPAEAPLEALPPAEKIWVISFKPRPELYANANEALPLLRELGRLGQTEVVLDDTTLPALPDLDPEGAYLTWTVTLHSACEETAIREVFEFVEDDCLLEIAAQGSAEAVDEGFDLGEGFEFEIFAPGGEGVDFEIYAPDADEPAVIVEPVHAEQAAVGPVEAMAAKAEAGAPVGATIRVDLDRVDRLINLVGELVINEAMLSQRVLEAGITRASAVAMALEELEHLTREIQDSVMAIRAQPVRSVFMRMPRLVREVASQTGKQVRLLTEGEGTEVDKTVIERIADPLTHMIRNAIDHGLESAEGRAAAGKPLEGTVKLIAVHRSGRIVLEVSDDGGGINRPRVKQKAIENGLIAPDAQLTDNEIDNLIFLPGFSTAQTISNISGRGVGMDVVRQSVQALGGRISITSVPGVGSTFTLSLPLTLAVLDGMVVRVGSHTMIVPLGTVIETLKPKPENVHALDAQHRVLSLRGGYTPLIDVAEILGYSDTPIDLAKAVALLVEGEGGRRAVLLVDAIDGQRQVVIKSLEANYRAVPGIAAATVMGDGRVALILDIDAVVSVTRTEAGRRADSKAVEISFKSEMSHV
ncbi:chemotaxis protein CheA [Acidocella sp.]|jgi:two-component system chemotaxis sensor kinase CheA|uniref:chemotaxis protein CheA n=1 Tax=Acidocella sp. TaxID=50710 RepID=UPI002F42D94C